MSSLPSRKRSPHDFIFKQELGHGSYSTVFKAIDKTNLGRVYAIKVCSKQHIIKEGKVKYVTIEKNTLNLLTRARHPGIVKLHYTFHDEENLYFVLDYASGGELLSLLHKMGTFNDLWARHFTCQIIDAMEFIHSQGILHRDLKPENLLLNADGRLMITDFGTATTPACTSDQADASSTRCSSFVGTAEYVSPELLLHNKCDFSSDIWALGCMIYQFVQGKPPFRGENELQTFEKTVALDYPWNNSTMPKGVNPLIVRLTRKILVLDPSLRLTLPAIKQDKWFESVDWNNKELLWRGIWQIQQPLARNHHHMIKNRQLHVIDTPIRNIPITKQKKKKPTKVSNTTSSIVEWRKKLGIATNDPLSAPDTNALQQSQQLRGAKNHPVLAARPSSSAVKPTIRSAPLTQPPSVPVSPVKKSSSLPRLSVNVNNMNSESANVTIPTNDSAASPTEFMKSVAPKNNGIDSTQQNSLVLKQDCVNLFEIPYRLNGPDMSLKSYNRVDNDLITQLVLQHESDLRSSSPSLLTLFKDGTLSYRCDSTSRHIVNIGDTNLSMYDFDFYEKKGTGFLILEKYKAKIWFISIPTQMPTVFKGSIKNKEENWIACFFRARQLMEDQKMLDKIKDVRLSDKVEQVETPSPTTIAGAKEVSTNSSNGKVGVKRKTNNIRRNVSSPTLGHPTISHKNTRSPATSPVLPQSPTMKRYAAPQNMVISSSRYEALNAIRPNSANDDASSGASAAFKNLQKRKTSMR